MELKLYLKSRCMSQKEFATLIGVSVASLNHYLNGTRKISLKHALKINEVTQGKVSLKELWLIHERAASLKNN